MNDTARLKLVEEIYAQLPSINCQKLCHIACGPVVVSRLELKRLHSLYGVKGRRLPTRVESGQRMPGLGRLIETGASFQCPLLKDGQCSAYQHRPFICRLWGLTERLKCPFGCVPERVVPEKEAYELMMKGFELGF